MCGSRTYLCLSLSPLHMVVMASFVGGDDDGVGGGDGGGSHHH